MENKKIFGLDRTALIVIAVILGLFLIMILIPQSFWVNLSIKLFK